jgi:hypothetical protein
MKGVVIEIEKLGALPESSLLMLVSLAAIALAGFAIFAVYSIAKGRK